VTLDLSRPLEEQVKLTNVRVGQVRRLPRGDLALVTCIDGIRVDLTSVRGYENYSFMYVSSNTDIVIDSV
jgi:hypothetical protein